MLYKLQLGSATQVRLATRFHATVSQKRSRKEGSHQQLWSSEKRALHRDRPGTRKMAVATTRYIMAFHGGHRRRESSKELWANMPLVSRAQATFHASLLAHLGALWQWRVMR